MVKIPATAFEIKSSWEISSSPQAQDNDPYQGSRPLKTSNLIDRKRVASSAFPPAKHLAKNSNTFKTEIMSGDTINSDFQEDLVKEKVVCLNGVSKVKKPASTQSLLERLRAANKTT